MSRNLTKTEGPSNEKSYAEIIMQNAMKSNQNKKKIFINVK